MKRKILDKILLSTFLAPSVVVYSPSLERGYWRIRYKKEVAWTKVLAGLVGNFAHFLKVNVQSLYIVSSDLILRFRQFTRSLVLHA